VERTRPGRKQRNLFSDISVARNQHPVSLIFYVATSARVVSQSEPFYES
jgi:hypothetical protein